MVNGELPNDLSQTLVFTNQSLEYLQQRIMVLQHEKLEQRELYKQARQQHKQLIRDRREIEIRIESEFLSTVWFCLLCVWRVRSLSTSFLACICA